MNKLLSITIILLILPFVASVQDSDLDGIPDADDILPFDYDNDGMPDSWEKEHRLAYDTHNANNDKDGDGFTNIDEYKRGTDPNVKDDPEEIITSIEVEANPELKKLIKNIGIVFLIVVIIFLIFKLIIFMKNKQTKKTTTNVTIEKQIIKQTIQKREIPKIRKKVKRKKEDMYIPIEELRKKDLKKNKDIDVFDKLKKNLLNKKEKNVFDKLKEYNKNNK